MLLRIALLGAQTITGTGSAGARRTSARALELLTWLVIHGDVPQNRHRLAGLLWPESSDAQALTNLRRELHTLRRMVDDRPCLLITARDLCWEDVPEVEVDVRRFRLEHGAALAAGGRDDLDAAAVHAERAVAQYRGDLLPGCYADWLPERRAELREQGAQLCTLLTDWYALRGRTDRALDAALRRIRLAPLDEAGYRAAMILQLERGDRAAAVNTYHRCASALEHELGVGPDDATRATLSRAMHRGRTAPVHPGPGRFVGRSREHAVLRDAWRGAEQGRPGLVVVGGNAGVGKTRLVTQLAEDARQSGGVVATSQCFDTSGRLALAPIADWLRSPGLRAAVRGLDPVWRAEVERLAPTGAGHPEPAVGSRAMVDAWQRHRFSEGLARALLAVGRPTLLVLDDLQWCDRESLDFLGFALRLAPQVPILVCATLRTGGGGPARDLGAWISRMRATAVVTELDLAPLEPDDTARLAHAVTGRVLAGADVELLQATTGGFPLHVIEAMRAAAQQDGVPLPAGDLTLVLRSRLQQAEPTTREVAGLAAAVGREFPLDLLVEASDLDPDNVVQAVDDLWHRRILTERDGCYDFSHDLLRDAAYAQVSPPRRWLLHRRLAQSLELLHGDDADQVCGQLAEQYARAGRLDRALPFYLRAAGQACAVFAHGEAIRLYAQALAIVRRRAPGAESDRQELLVLESMAAPLNARDGYSCEQLRSVLERSRELARKLGNQDALLRALIGLWASQFVSGQIAQAHETVGTALALAGEGSEYRGAAHFAFGGSAVTLGRPGEGAHHFALAEQATGGESLSIGTRADVHGRAWSAHALWLLGEKERALATSESAVALARSLDHPYSLAVALAYGGITGQLCGARAGPAKTVAELHDLCERYGFGYYRDWALILDGWCRGGGEGLDLARRGITRLRAERSLARMPYWLSLLAELLDEAGDRDAARSALDAAAANAFSHGDLWWLPEVERRRAALADPRTATSLLRHATELARAHGSVALLERCLHDLGEPAPGAPAAPAGQPATANDPRTQAFLGSGRGAHS